MSGEVGALGDLATAGLIAHSLDGPPAAHGAAGHGACENCGAALHGHFCSHCGQHAEIHRSVGHLAEEFLHGITHFDSKAWRTLPLLAFRPGRLTRDYVHGKRARYIPPLALFLFSIFLMFFVFGLVGGPDLVKFDDTDGVVAGSPEAAAARQAGRPAPRRSWQEVVRESARKGQIKIDTGSASIDANILKTLENPDFALYRVKQSAYKLSFLLVPLTLPVLWLMFAWRRSVHTYDHVVFELYSLSFMSMLLVVGATLGKLATSLGEGLGEALNLLVLVPPVHIFFQLKGAYALTFGGALWRTVILVLAALMTLALFAMLIVVVGLAD